MVFVMPLVEELAKFELISDKKIACGAKNVQIMKNISKTRKNWHFCDNFSFFSELEKCQNNMVFEKTGYETPPENHPFRWFFQKTVKSGGKPPVLVVFRKNR